MNNASVDAQTFLCIVKHRRSYSILLGLLLIVLANPCPAADFTWTNAAGDGLWSSPGNWWTNGGAALQAPSPDDNAIFDANSFLSPPYQVEVDLPTATCKTMKWAGVSNNPTFISSSPNNQLLIHGELKLEVSANMLWDFDGTVWFQATQDADITSAGQVFKNNIYFNEPTLTRSWSLQDDLICDKYIVLEQGFLKTNGHTVKALGFHSANSNPRRLELSTSLFTLTGSLTVNFSQAPWYVLATNLSFDAGGSQLEFHGENAYMYASGQAYNNVHFVHDKGWGTIRGVNSFAELKMSGHGRFLDDNSYDVLTLQTGRIYTLEANKTQSVHNLVADGDCALGRITFQSSIKGQEAMLEALTAAFTLHHVILQDIKATGATPFVAKFSYDMGNNTNWQFVSPGTEHTYLWIGGQNGGNLVDKLWSNPANWFNLSLGTTDGCLPGPCSKLTFDNQSFLNNNELIVDVAYALCHDMDWTGASNNPIFSSDSPLNYLGIRGRLIFIAYPSMDVTYNGQTLFLESCPSMPQVNTLTLAGQTLRNNVTFHGFGGHWELQDKLTVAGTNGGTTISSNNGGFVTLNYGVLDLNAQDMECVAFRSTNDNTRTLFMQNSALTITGMEAGQGIYAWHVSDADGVNGLTIKTANSKISFLRNASLGTFFAQGMKFNDVEFQAYGIVHGSNNIDGKLEFFENGRIGRNGSPSSNKIRELVLSPGKTYTLQSNVTQRIVDDFSATGSCTEAIRIRASTQGNTARIRNLNAALYELDWLILQDVDRVAAGGPMDADNSTLINSANWGGTVKPPLTFWWRPGAALSANWSDPGNWSIVQVGQNFNPDNCIPWPCDDVNFDAASFSGGNVNVVVDVQTAYCDDMTWDHAPWTPVFTYSSAASELLIFGSLDMCGSGCLMTNNYQRPVFFEQKGGGSNTIELAGGVQLGHNASFTGNLKDWTLLSDLYAVGSLNVVAGELKTQNNDLDVNRLYGFNGGTLTLASNTVTVRGNSTENGSTVSLSFDQSFVFDKGSSTLLLTGTTWPTLVAPNHVFHDLEFTDADAFARVWSATTYNDLSFDGNGEFTNNATMLNLNFSAGKSYEFKHGKNYSFLSGGSFTALGTAVAPIYIRTDLSLNECFLNKPDGSVCLDYVYMRDNHNLSLPNIPFWAGIHSANVANNFGWAFTTCGPPPPTVICHGQPHQFNVGLGIGTWDWDFDDPGCIGPNCNTAAIPNPVHLYSAPGNYNTYVDIGNLSPVTWDRTYFNVQVVGGCCNDWPLSAGSNIDDDFGTDVELDNDFNVYYTGYMTNGTDFQAPYLGLVGSGYLVKYDVCGQIDWLEVLPGFGERMKMNPDKSEIYVVGSDGISLFITAYDLNGNNLWTEWIIASSGWIRPGSIDADDEHVYICGYFNGTINVNGAGAFGSSSDWDGIVATYHIPTAAFSSAAQIFGNSAIARVTPRGIAFDETTGDIYVVGSYNEMADFIGNALSTSGMASFAARYDNSLGNQAAITSFDNQLNEVEMIAPAMVATVSDLGRLIAYDAGLTQQWNSPSSGKHYYDLFYDRLNDWIYTVGNEDASLVEQNVLVEKFQSNGTQEWSVTSTQSPVSLGDIGYGIAAAGNGLLFTTGFYTGNIELPGPLNSLGASMDIFMARLEDNLSSAFFFKPDIGNDLSGPANEEKAAPSDSFELYPNPTNGVFYLKLPATAGESTAIDVTILDMFGREILHFGELTQNELKVDLSDQSKGVYYLRLKQGGQESIRSVIYR